MPIGLGDEGVPLRGNLRQDKDGLDRTGVNAEPAIDALQRLDVEKLPIVLLFVDVGERECEDGWKSWESRPSPFLDCVAVLFMASSNPKPAWRITVIVP